jgi:hypothetical protein
MRHDVHPPSGASLAPPCDRDVCDGLRTYPTSQGAVDGHCWCPTGRSLTEQDYWRRHGSRSAS